MPSLPTPMLVLDTDQHMNETSGTWASADPAAVGDRPLEFREVDGRRALFGGDEVLVPARPTMPDDNRRIEEMVAADPTAYDRERQAEADDPTPFEELEHPTGDGNRRVRELEDLATTATILLPTYGLFWSSFATAKGFDREWINANLAAWNDWVAGLSAVNTDRLLGIGQIEFNDVDVAVAEIHRCKELGLRGVMVHMRAYRDVPWSDASNEPVWRALEETGLALILHIAAAPTHIDKVWIKPEIGPPVHSGQSFRGMLNRSYPVEAVLTDLIVEGVFSRHPDLRVGIIECGGAWVHGFLDRLDWTWRFLAPRNTYLRNRLDGMPSEVFKRHVKVALLPGEQSALYLDLCGPDVFMYSSDFPHKEGTAHGVELFREELSGVADPATLDAFWFGNAQWLLGVDAKVPAATA